MDYKTVREAKGISLRSIFEETRVSLSNLEAIERGDFAVLPAPVIARSFIREYAHAIGYEPEDLLLAYENFLQAQERLKSDAVAKTTDPRQAGQRLLQHVIPDILQKKAIIFKVILASLAIAVVAAAFALFPQTGNKESMEVIAPVVNTTNSAQYSITIAAKERAWIKVVIDGALTEEFSLSAGDSIERTANKSIVVHSGNAGGTSIIFQGQDIGAIGRRGEIVRVVLPPPENANVSASIVVVRPSRAARSTNQGDKSSATPTVPALVNNEHLETTKNAESSQLLESGQRQVAVPAVKNTTASPEPTVSGNKSANEMRMAPGDDVPTAVREVSKTVQEKDDKEQRSIGTQDSASAKNVTSEQGRTIQ
ncbi:MAG: DUF4115 domain-containing protein [Deltaproteobacteria bacterium]|nr:DUF4115 domain-containing protein [Deltaproteobacteria bacterium]